jgi:membrane fusion protein (multidrug efflux system)
MPSAAAFQAAAETGQTVPAAPLRRRVKRAAIAVAALLAGAAAVDFAYDYWTTGRFEVSTDDAYVKADFTTIAPKVSGYLNAVLVEDNQKVKAGQVLARIDDRDFRTALDQANAQVASARAAIANLDAQTALQQSVIDQAKATIAATQASLRFSQADAARYADLAKTGAGSVQRAQQTEAARTEQTAGLQRDQAGLLGAQKKLAVLATDRAQAEAELAKAQALARQAELNLSYTVISAPVDGTVGARSLRVGEYVTGGTQLMAVVPLDAVYIVANFKETQLTDVRGGQPVQVSVDTFPGARLKGHVDSVSPASGLEFSLLPPDNATGNFTKIVQRIPVKIMLDDPALAERLRAGMSVEPTINTKPAKSEPQVATSF